MALHKFLCPKCHVEVCVPQEAIGQRAKCCKCGESVLIPSPEKDKSFRLRLVDEQRAELEEKSRQAEAQRMREEEVQRIRAENERKLEDERLQEDKRRQEVAREKQEEERQAELRRLYEVRHSQEKQEQTRLEHMIDVHQEFKAPEIIDPEDSASFVYFMGVILFLAGIVGGFWGIADALNKDSVIPFIIGTAVLLQCFLMAAILFLARGFTRNMFYICKNLEHHSRQWQDAREK